MHGVFDLWRDRDAVEAPELLPDEVNRLSFEIQGQRRPSGTIADRTVVADMESVKRCAERRIIVEGIPSAEANE